MPGKYKYDVFLSYASEDRRIVESLYDKITELGLICYWAERTNRPSEAFIKKIGEALEHSQQFVVYYSKHAMNSDYVEKECNLFFTLNIKDPAERPLYVLLDDTCGKDDIPFLLKELHQPKSTEDLLSELNKHALSTLRNEIESEKKKVEEARKYYRHDRFWRGIAENKDLHIFTCGRDVQNDPKSQRGYGGRTNIDVWDYRAVLDIMHFFSSRYPNTKITIEDPMSKLQEQDHTDPRQFHMTSKLVDHDCIIVGSPDVSDFAEIVLADIHKINPYYEERIKRKGYILIKEHKGTKSSFYWEKGEGEKEGVAQILDEECRYFPHKIAEKDGKPGKMYGILVVANNPFCRTNQPRKIVILSGFSGVATRGIAKILTDEAYLDEFFKLDQAYIDINRNVEVLVGVEYDIDSFFINRDTRQIKAITFEGLVEI